MLVAHFSKSIDRSTCASFKRPRITIDKESHKEGRATHVQEERNRRESGERREYACVSFLGDALTSAGRYRQKPHPKCTSGTSLNLASETIYRGAIVLLGKIKEWQNYEPHCQNCILTFISESKGEKKNVSDSK